MSATPITPVKRFFAPEITKIAICTTVADKAAPTRANIDAGTEVLPEVSAVNGFQIAGNAIDAGDYGSRFTAQITGRTQVGDCSLVFYQDQGTDDVRTWLTQGTTVFVLIMWGGDVEGQLMDVFPAEVLSCGLSIPDNAAADITVSFAITSKPAVNVEIPAAA